MSKNTEESSIYSSNRMVDVSPKEFTKRRAIAEGRLLANPITLDKIRLKLLPKGDALAIAELTGIITAKKTAELLPLCHPLPLDYVKVNCEVFDTFVRATCEVAAFAKTGVEMEALQGVTAALLCVYDLAKSVDKDLTISDITVIQKEGGQSGISFKPASQSQIPILDLHSVNAAVITISDRCFQKQAEDLSGPFIEDKLISWNAICQHKMIVPDEKMQIQSALNRFALEEKMDLIITTGGTGLGPRDITIESLQQMTTKNIPGIGEMLRQKGSHHTSMAWLSQCYSGLIQETLVIALPGSLKAVKEGMDALAPILQHALRTIKGGQHEDSLR